MLHQGFQSCPTRTYVLVAILVFFTLPPSFASIKEISLTKQLKARGIDPNDLPEVRRLAKSAPSRTVRLLCIRYLASKKEDITGYLKDSHSRVRIRVARLLTDAGSRDGLPVMIKEYEELVRNGMAKDEGTFLNVLRKTKTGKNLTYALDAGEVLARLGDFRCLGLAELAIEHARFAKNRYRAIAVLTSVLGAVKNATEGKDPQQSDAVPEYEEARKRAKASLMRCARNEKERYVLGLLVGLTARVGNDRQVTVKVGFDDALEILSAVESRTDIPDRTRRGALLTLKKVQAKATAENTGGAPPDKTPPAPPTAPVPIKAPKKPEPPPAPPPAKPPAPEITKKIDPPQPQVIPKPLKRQQPTKKDHTVFYLAVGSVVVVGLAVVIWLAMGSTAGRRRRGE